MKQLFSFISILSFFFFLNACTGLEQAPEKEEKVVLTPASFDQLKGWKSDQVGFSILAFQKSCDRIAKKDPENKFSRIDFAGKVKDWLPACQQLPTIDVKNHDEVRNFYQQYFDLYQIKTPTTDEGLFTGYYEASLHGSLQQTDQYSTPLYRRPGDLVMVDLGDFRDDLKGRRIAGRVNDARLKPYETREEIEQGTLQGQALELIWVNDPTEAFFLHIQGSGRIILDNGETIRVGYDGQNGHVYHAIGKSLIEMGAIDKENVSLQSIRAWLDENPDQAEQIKNTNPSYVFFKKLDGDGPIGGEGVALTAGRSLAVDYNHLPYGVPVFLDVEHPLNPENRLQRLFIAQDTGGAIRGPIRGDVFWGYGEQAENVAGVMKSKGKKWILLPKKETTKPIEKTSEPYKLLKQIPNLILMEP